MRLLLFVTLAAALAGATLQLQYNTNPCVDFVPQRECTETPYRPQLCVKTYERVLRQALPSSAFGICAYELGHRHIPVCVTRRPDMPYVAELRVDLLSTFISVELDQQFDPCTNTTSSVARWARIAATWNDQQGETQQMEQLKTADDRELSFWLQRAASFMH